MCGMDKLADAPAQGLLGWSYDSTYRYGWWLHPRVADLQGIQGVRVGSGVFVLFYISLVKLKGVSGRMDMEMGHGLGNEEDKLNGGDTLEMEGWKAPGSKSMEMIDLPLWNINKHYGHILMKREFSSAELLTEVQHSRMIIGVDDWIRVGRTSS